jgi:hypothetical protein
MSQTENKGDSPSKTSFSQEADEAGKGIVGEFVEYLRYNKKWWLTPIIVVLLMVGVLVIFGGSAAAPFIYTLF